MCGGVAMVTTSTPGSSSASASDVSAAINGEAIELRRPAEAQVEAARAAAALARYADVVRRAADALAAALR